MRCGKVMRTSPYFEQALFYGQSPATDQFFEERSEYLFQVLGKESFIEIHDQLPWPQEAPNGSNLLGSKQKCDSSLDDDFSSVPPSPLDQCLYLDEEPPRYIEVPGLRRQIVRDSQDLKQIAEVRDSVRAHLTPTNIGIAVEDTKRNFRIWLDFSLLGLTLFIQVVLISMSSFIRQRHSHSRLLVTRELFETLMSEFHVLPRFREFVLLFGAKHGENELEPPLLRFRRLQAGNSELGCQSCPGFGIVSDEKHLSVADWSRYCIWT